MHPLWSAREEKKKLKHRGLRDLCNRHNGHLVVIWGEASLRRKIAADLIGVRGVLPGHVEHVPDLLRQADASAAVGGDVDAGEAALPRHLRGSQEQHVLLRPERADLVRDVVAYDDDLATARVLGRAQSHSPGHHANLRD